MLTCLQAMQFHAWLRSAHSTPADEVHARMQEALAVMGLWRVRDTPVRVCKPRSTA